MVGYDACSVFSLLYSLRLSLLKTQNLPSLDPFFNLMFRSCVSSVSLAILNLSTVLNANL